MEAIILAGGFGTRLRSIVSDVPKPMAPIGKRPFLELLLDNLERSGFSHIVLSTGYLHEKIEQHFGNQYQGMEISYAVETTPLGTGGGIRNAVEKCKEQAVTVLNGDTLFDIDFTELQRFYSSHTTRLAVVLREVDDTARYGAIDIDNDGRVCRFFEKAVSGGAGLINGGIYMLDRQLIEEFPLGEKFSFEQDLLQKKYKDESFYAYPSSAYFIDIGIPEDYKKLIKDRKNRD